MTNVYIYDDGNLLEDRNSYTYTTYHGDTFLRDWRIKRDNILNSLPEGQKLGTVTDYTRDKITINGYYNSHNILRYLQNELTTQSQISSEAMYFLNRLVQRFEVTKRIHDSYLASWRAVDKSQYKNLSLYILFCDVMHLAYMSSSRLDFLNVFLKCLDTLISQKDKLSTQDQAHLAYFITTEKEYIESIQENLETCHA